MGCRIRNQHPLLCALWDEKYDEVILLINKPSINIIAVDSYDNMDVFMIAVWKQKIGLVKLLLSKYSIIKTCDLEYILNRVDNDNNNALNHCLTGCSKSTDENRLEIFKLIEDVRKRKTTRVELKKLIFDCLFFNRINIYKYLCEKYNISDDEIAKVLNASMENCRLESIESMRLLGFDLNLPYHKYSIFDIALKKSYKDGLQYCIENKLNMHTYDTRKLNMKEIYNPNTKNFQYSDKRINGYYWSIFYDDMRAFPPEDGSKQ